MKILKYLFFLILLIIIGSAIYFGTKESSYEIRDVSIIQAPPEVVFNQVNELKNWEKWEVWEKEDPNIVFNYAEQTSGEGASFSWDGKESGTITTTKVIPDNEIEQELTLRTSRGTVNAEMHWQFDAIDGNTDVTWILRGEHSLIDKIYYSISGKDFNADWHAYKKSALANISEQVAENMARYSINVDGITQYGGGYYMYVTSAAKQSQLRKKMVPMLDEVERFMERNNLDHTGNRFLLYNEINTSNNTVILSTCYPVKEKVITPQSSPVLSDFMEPVTAVKTSLKGNYDHIPEAYERAREYITERGYREDPDRNVFEVFVTDPDNAVNPADWVTEIYIPIINEPESEPEPNPEFNFDFDDI